MLDSTLLRAGVYAGVAGILLLRVFSAPGWLMILYVFVNPATLVFIHIIYKRRAEWDYMLNALAPPPDKRGRKSTNDKPPKNLYD